MSTAIAKPDLVVEPDVETQALSPFVDSPLPVFTGEQMAKAFVAYQDLQRALDRAMPDQIMNLDGRKFRKKGYWRAVAVAFNLTVEPIHEKRETSGQFADGQDNFGHLVTYQAKAPNGRIASGDGSCFAVEKARRFKCPHPEYPGSKRTVHFPHSACPDFDPAFQWRTLPQEATEHNVRSHAHTRAFNRAVSNLCGFGEVSAEEVPHDNGHTVEPQADDAAAGAGKDIRTRVTDVRIKNGKSKAGKPYVKYVIKTEAGDFSTFEKADAEIAKAAREAGQMVRVTYRETQYGRDLMVIAEVDQTAEEVARAAAAEPPL